MTRARNMYKRRKQGACYMAKGVIASRLKELRESLKLSQAKVASLNGTTTQASINRYENQQSDSSLDILLWYADFFDASLD